MTELPRTRLERWRYALKPASWPKLLAPMLLGQALGVHAAQRTGQFSLRHASFVLLWGVVLSLVNLATIVLLNDWADRDVDALKRRMFPDAGSPKTIYDGILPAKQLLFGGLASGIATLALGVVGAVYVGTPFVILLVLSGLVCFWAYSLPPLRLNYRGGGELLEMLGVGVVFPWIFCSAQGRSWGSAELVLLIGFAPLALASAVASGLSDEQSDRRGGKRTLVTTLGNPSARKLIRGCLPLSAVLLFVGVALSPLATWLVLPLVAAVLLGWWAVARADVGADTGAFRRLGELKRVLHLAIWGSQLLAALLVLLTRG